MNQLMTRGTKHGPEGTREWIASDQRCDVGHDAWLAGTDAATVFHSGELLSELRQRLAERILDAEMEVHLDQGMESERGNTRNGHNRKTVLTDSGSMPLAVPRDRQGTFEPQLVERYCRRLPGFDAKVTQLFAHGMSTRHIQRAVQEL